jgi:hypothetical protein
MHLSADGVPYTGAIDSDTLYPSIETRLQFGPPSTALWGSEQEI